MVNIDAISGESSISDMAVISYRPDTPGVSSGKDNQSVELSRTLPPKADKIRATCRFGGFNLRPLTSYNPIFVDLIAR